MVLRMAGRAQSALLRERATLESAVVRPQNAAFYEGADLVTQAALYMVGIAFNHPFIDGNKRTGFLAGVTFLHVNGFEIEVGLNDPEIGVALEQVVRRSLLFDDFVVLLRQRSAAR